MGIETGKFGTLGTGKFSQSSRAAPPTPPTPPVVPPGVIFTTSIVLFDNVDAAAGVTNGSSYTGNTSASGGLLTVVNRVLVTTDGSGLECKITVEPPIFTDFTNVLDARILGQPSIVLASAVTSPGNTGSGWNGILRANTSTNGVDFYFECSQTNTQYAIDFTYTYLLNIPAKKSLVNKK